MEIPPENESQSDALRNAIDVNRVSAFEQLLEDVIEISDLWDLTHKLEEIEKKSGQPISELEKIRHGIILHDAAIKLAYPQSRKAHSYSLRSYTMLTRFSADSATPEAIPIVTAYRASSLAQIGLEKYHMKDVRTAFMIFKESIQKYGGISLMPEFIRGKASARLPWYYFRKKRLARTDFGSVIKKDLAIYNQTVNFKIISFAFYEMAALLTAEGSSQRVIEYLNKSISLDPNFHAARERAEKLRFELLRGKSKSRN